MAEKASKGSKDVPEIDWLGRLYLGFQLIPRGALLSVVGPLVLAILGYFGWRYWGAERLDRALYSLTAERLDVTPQPDWIPGNVKDEVLSSGALADISLLDRQATSSIARAFDSHPWVQETVLVEKSAGGHVRVRLTYRKPLALIFCQPTSESEQNEPLKSKAGFYAVDENGMVLPSDGFVVKSEKDYFLVFTEGAKPPSIAGAAFGDPKISQALLLCKLLEPVRQTWALRSIHVQTDPTPSTAQPWILGIVTFNKQQIVWGHAPGLEVSGEAPVPKKIEKLKNFFQSQASSLPAPTVIDLRFANRDAAMR
ncbi:MAG: hypothetical protein JNK90_15945 [Planctomycetaceae bacterium]|nr:hypothetical protein [Planctomycetaceae bacterium]MBN8601917.1 hypothetical protein [Planctomycetota bacterium]